MMPGPAPNATILGRLDLTPAIAQFVVRPDGATAFRPGQYFALGLDVGGRLVQRPYSTASPIGSRDLEFLVRLVPRGALTPHLWRSGVGDRLRIGRPKGIFTLIDGDPRTHLFVATGTGIAPFMSMLATVVSRPGANHPIVVHGVSSSIELAYRERLVQPTSGLTYIPVVSRPDRSADTGWMGAIGHVGDALHPLLDRGAIRPEAIVAYLCGNPGMVANTRDLLLGAGVPADAIRSEEYWVAGAAAA